MEYVAWMDRGRIRRDDKISYLTNIGGQLGEGIMIIDVAISKGPLKKFFDYIQY